MSRIRLPSIRRLTSVRSRLTLWNVLALTVALTAVSVQIRYSVRANILASIDRELSSMARYSSRMNGRRGRGRLAGLGSFAGAFPSPSFSGTMRQLDAQMGLPTPQGISPAPAPENQPAPMTAPDSTARQSEQAAGAQNGPTQASEQSQLPARGRRGDAIPNSPATRILINGPHTLLNEPPWDMNAYTRAVAENTEVYTTVERASRPTRILTHPLRIADGESGTQP